MYKTDYPFGARPSMLWMKEENGNKPSLTLLTEISNWEWKYGEGTKAQSLSYSGLVNRCSHTASLEQGVEVMYCSAEWFINSCVSWGLPRKYLSDLTVSPLPMQSQMQLFSFISPTKQINMLLFHHPRKASVFFFLQNTQNSGPRMELGGTVQWEVLLCYPQNTETLVIYGCVISIDS